MHRSVKMETKIKSGLCVQAGSVRLQILPKRFSWPDSDKVKASSNMAMTSLGQGPQFGYPSVTQ